MASALQQYPVELLQRIFSYLVPDDVLHMLEDPVVGDFAFATRYKRIFYAPENHYESSQDNHYRVNMIQLFNLMKESRFHPNIIIFESFDDFLDLDAFHPRLLIKFKGIEIISSAVDSDQLEILSKYNNITEVVLGNELLSSFSLPPSLTRIELISTTIDKPFPSTIDHLCLEVIDYFKSSFLPPNLKTLELRQVERFQLDVRLPLAITELKLENVQFGELTAIYGQPQADFSYLEKLKWLVLDEINCDIYKLPPNLLYFFLSNCVVLNLEKITPLTKIREIEITGIDIANCDAFDIKYPISLRKLDISDATLILPLNEGDRRGHLPRNVFSIKLPPFLKEFSFSGSDDIYLHGDMSYPDTINTLMFWNLPGIYYDDIRTTTHTLRDIELPKNLESLKLFDCDIDMINNIDLDLPRLQELDFSRTPIDLSLIKVGSHVEVKI